MIQMKESTPNDERNNCWGTRPTKYYQYQLVYKTTANGWERWWNRYQMMYEATVDWWDQWDQWRTTQTRWCTKQLLMDQTDDGLETIRWSYASFLAERSVPHLGWNVSEFSSNILSFINFLITSIQVFWIWIAGFYSISSVSLRHSTELDHQR